MSRPDLHERIRTLTEAHNALARAKCAVTEWDMLAQSLGLSPATAEGQRIFEHRAEIETRIDLSMVALVREIGSLRQQRGE